MRLNLPSPAQIAHSSRFYSKKRLEVAPGTIKKEGLYEKPAISSTGDDSTSFVFTHALCSSCCINDKLTICLPLEVITMDIAIIVEGKNDRSKLQRLLDDRIAIFCTFGTPGTAQLDRLRKQVGNRHVFIFTDNDSSGRHIRGILYDLFPDAEPIYTRKGYAGVENTPEEYLIEQLEKAGLEEHILYPEPDPSSYWTKDDFLT